MCFQNHNVRYNSGFVIISNVPLFFMMSLPVLIIICECYCIGGAELAKLVPESGKQ